VLVDPNTAAPVVVGYITLVSSEIQTNGEMTLTQNERADGYNSQPGVKIARLAIHKDCQGNGYGGDLVSFAISMVVDGVMPVIGCRFMIVDSKPDAVGKYEEWGFTMLDTADNRASEHPLLYLDLHKLVQGDEFRGQMSSGDIIHNHLARTG